MSEILHKIERIVPTLYVRTANIINHKMILLLPDSEVWEALLIKPHHAFDFTRQ